MAESGKFSGSANQSLTRTLHYPVAASGRPPHTDAAALQCTALTAERFCTGSARTRGQPHGAFLRSVRPWGGEDGEP